MWKAPYRAALSTYAHPVRRMMRLKQHGVNFRQFIEPFLLTVLNVSYCACEKPFVVLSTTVLWSNNRHMVESNTI